MHCRKICVLLYRSTRLKVFCKKCVLIISQISQKNTCVGVSLIKKRLQRMRFPVNFAKFLRTPFLTTTPVVASVIILSWLWNHVQSQQQKNKVRSVGSLRSRVAGGSGEAGILVVDDIGWFQVVCCFRSYTKFTTYRRFISSLYSWMHVIDWGHYSK